MSNKAIRKLHTDMQHLNAAKESRHAHDSALHKDQRALKTDKKQLDRAKDKFEKNQDQIGTQREQLSTLKSMEQTLLKPLETEVQQLQQAYDASVDPTTGQGDPTLQTQLQAMQGLEADFKGMLDPQVASQQQKVDALKDALTRGRLDMKHERTSITHDRTGIKKQGKAYDKAKDRVTADRKRARKDLLPAEYKMGLKATNKAREALGLKKVKHVIRPDAGNAKTVDLAKKYLGRYESDLQAHGITQPCPTSESCANFVTSMLSKSGAINFRTLSVADENNQLRARGWHTVSLANAKPGDVWICNGANGESHTEIVASNKNGHVTLIGSNNHPVSSNQQINYDTYSANISGSFILAPPGK